MTDKKESTAVEILEDRILKGGHLLNHIESLLIDAVLELDKRVKVVETIYMGADNSVKPEVKVEATEEEDD